MQLTWINPPDSPAPPLAAAPLVFETMLFIHHCPGRSRRRAQAGLEFPKDPEHKTYDIQSIGVSIKQAADTWG